MSKHAPMTDADGEVRELTAEDLQGFRPAAQVLPPDLMAGLVALKKQRGERGPQKSPVKVSTTLRLDADVLDTLRASGKGWQTRVNDILRDWLKDHPASIRS